MLCRTAAREEPKGVTLWTSPQDRKRHRDGRIENIHRNATCATLLYGQGSALEESTVNPRSAGRHALLHLSKTYPDAWLTLLVATSGLGGAWLLRHVHIPAAWLVGPLIVSVLWQLFGPGTPSVPRWGQRLAMALIGAHLAGNVTPQVLDTLQGAFGAAVFIVLLLLAASVGGGLLFARLTRMDTSTGVLSFLPGAASAIVVLSRDLHADPRFVSTMQYLRMTIVVLVTPFIAASLVSSGFVAHSGMQGNIPAAAPPLAVLGVEGWDNGLPALALTWGSVMLGLWLGQAIAFPAVTLLVPLGVLVTAAALGHPGAPLPPWLISGAFVVVGMWAGLQFDRQAVAKAGKAALWALPLIFALILVSSVAAVLLSRLSEIPLVTAFLATAPGGLEAMVATSLHLGADAALVLAIQLLRFLVILVMAPFIAHRLTRSRAGGQT